MLSYITEDVSYMVNIKRKTNREISDLYEHCTMFTRRNELDAGDHGDGGGDADDPHGRG
jgi:hypothetical protein